MFDNPNAMRVAERFTQAIASLNAQALADLYTDDVVIWHNTTNKTQSKEENISLMRKIFDLLSEFGYHDIRRFPTPEGFVQCHTAKPVFKDGSPAGEAYVCMVVKVEGDKVAKLNEFLDASQLAKLWERLGEGALAG